MKKTENMLTKINSARYYEWLISLTGACVIAFALGTVFSSTFLPLAPFLLLIGVLMHGWAMYTIHHRNK